MDKKDFTYPLMLLVIGIVIFIGYGVFLGDASPLETILSLGIVTTIQVIFGIIACYIVAGMMSIGFGTLGTASLKLAAAMVFPNAAALLVPIPFVNWIVALVLYFSLLAWFFSLDVTETFVLVIILFLIRLLAIFVIMGMIVTMIG